MSKQMKIPEKEKLVPEEKKRFPSIDKWHPLGTEKQKTLFFYEGDKSKNPYVCFSKEDAINFFPSTKGRYDAIFVKQEDLKPMYLGEYNQYNFEVHLAYRTPKFVKTEETWSGLSKHTVKNLGWKSKIQENMDPLVKQDPHPNILFARSSKPKNYRFWVKLRRNNDGFQPDKHMNTDTLSYVAIELEEAIKRIKVKKPDQTEWTFTKPNESNEYVFLSKNPFELYQTWIHKADLIDWLKSYPDHNYPTEKQVDAAKALLTNNLLNQHYYNGRAKTTKIKLINVMEAAATKSSTVHPDGELIWTAIASDTMQQPFQKKKRMFDQATVMGKTSASDFATKLGWGTKPAEWLHLSGYAWGGLRSLIDPANDPQDMFDTSQQPLNFCIGTPECNTHMLRYETAWQNLFREESKLVRAGDKVKKAAKPKRVKGELMVCNNMEVFVLEPRREKQKTYPADPDDNKLAKFEAYNLGQGEWTLQKAWDRLHCLVFAMEYQVTLYGDSIILGLKDAKSDVRFYPFRRQLTTMTECQLDKVALEALMKWCQDPKPRLA